jgi:hypothetical protein
MSRAHSKLSASYIKGGLGHTAYFMLYTGKEVQVSEHTFCFILEGGPGLTAYFLFYTGRLTAYLALYK